jgi:hypothetical protein
MRAGILGGLAVVAGLSLTSRVEAQTPFQKGDNYIGPSVSLSTYGSAFAIGGNFEHALKEHIGIGAAAQYYSYGCGIADCNFRVITLAGTLAYHFDVKNEKVDLFAGGALGTNIVSCSASGFDCNDAFGHSLVIGGFGGVRYFMKENLALVGRVGYGVGYLSAGIDFKF